MNAELKTVIAEAMAKAELDDVLYPRELKTLAQAALQAIKDAGCALADLRTHVIVPREPTEAMLAALPSRMQGDEMSAPEIWAAMITASQREGDGK